MAENPKSYEVILLDHTEMRHDESGEYMSIFAIGGQNYKLNAKRQNLWGVFNVVQENVIRGGQKGWVERLDARGRAQTRRASTRAVAGIDGNRDLNRALWTLAEEMAKLKGAA